MPFLTASDYNKQIRSEKLDQITDGDSTILPAVNLAVEAEITGYLRHRYKVSEILAATGTSRNQLLVMYAVDMVIYHTISRINPRQITEHRLARYEAAIAWLKSVNKGEILPDLPLKDDPDGTDPNVHAESASAITFAKRQNNY